MRRPDGGEDPVYIHKPSLMGAPWELHLRPDALEWHTGRHQGRIPYARVTRVRLSFRPVTMQDRLGEHSAVVCMLVNRSPLAASRSKLVSPGAGGPPPDRVVPVSAVAL